MRPPRPRRRLRASLLRATAFAFTLTLVAPLAAGAVTIGFVDDFPGTSLNGWRSFATNSNPGTGGTLGAADGFARCARTSADFLGIHSENAPYDGDWLAAGAKLSLALNDVDSNENLSLHVGIGNTSNFWLCNVGFAPPEHAWGTFEQSFDDSTQFTQVVGVGSFAGALQNVDRILVRHDTAPFTMDPPTIVGQFGMDHVQILASGVGVGDPVPGTRQPVWLAPPSPNPSRGAVACMAETNAAGTLRFSVLDARGRVMRRASLDAASAGPQMWVWDGLDESGARVAAGVYVVRVVGAGGGTSRNIVRVD